MYENAFNSIERQLRAEEGIANELDYVEQTSWVLFLKYLHDLENERRDRAELDGDTYAPIITGPYRWDEWAAPKSGSEFDHNRAMIGDDLITFVDQQLFPFLASFRQSAKGPRTIEYKIGEVFTELRNKFRSGYILRDVLEILDGLNFNTQAERHELSELYESRIRRMGNAGRNGGEYYTPRPLIRAMIAVTDPQLGETIYDGAVGSAGFLCEAYSHMRPLAQTASDYDTLQNHTFYGQEKKGLAYIIGIMNMVLHGIEAPNLVHSNTLNENVMDIQEKDRHDIILANPPFGGGERREVQQNFPIRTGETAYLFLQHFIRKLRAGGRAAIVIKNTFLSNTDNASVALRKELLEAAELHTILDCPQGTFQGAGVKTVVLFFEKGAPTRDIWYYQLDPGRSMGKTNPLNDDDLAEFVELQHRRPNGPKSWIVNRADLDEDRGDRRILLTLATGTGKTSIAFQIAWKLFQAKWNLTGEPVRRPRILFLADRNILADQAYNSFSAFPNDAVTRIDPDTIRKNGGKPPKNASLFFTIFQTFMTGEGEPVYKQYAPDFFDFIVIDECHRGGAKDESEWRALLEYFEPAAQLGLTATPKRKHNADTYAYFGEPVYTYALRDGIEDGFLTPFKVRQMASTIDEYVYDGTDNVITGEIGDGEAFTESDFNRRIIIPERELARVREFMKQIDQREKTLVFCATQDHAALVRDLINQVKTSPNPNYCHRVTADDGAIGEQHLRDFQDNDKTIPTILTTSQKLSTGVDARNIRHIVLMRPIKSMIEFKQIIGRGTRTFDGKDFFTVWDFVKAHENFNDPEWDGEPLEPDEPGPPRQPGEPPVGPEQPEPGTDGGEGEEPKEKIVVQLADGKARTIRFIASTTYWSADGKPISAIEFLARLFGDLSTLVKDEDQLRLAWSDPDNRAHFLKQLRDFGYDQDRLDVIRQLVDAPKSDLFDVLSYVLFTNHPKTRQDRAQAVRDNRLHDVDGEMADLLLAILQAYEMKGESELASKKLGQFLAARYGTIGDSKAKLGELATVRAAFRRMQIALYDDTTP